MAPKGTDQDAEKLLARAPRILKEVMLSSIFQEQQIREFPSFELSEIRIGPVLGVGGFGIVKQVEAICLPRDTKDGVVEEDDTQNDEDEDEDDHNDHYDVRTAKQYMAENYVRPSTAGDGGQTEPSARYAIKKLKKDLTGIDRARGIVDLAIEAKYLSVLWHPNIVKMRGMASATSLSTDFFIVMDRLYGTLRDKMKIWKKTNKKASGNIFGMHKDKEVMFDLTLERMIVAYDLAAAFRYMHTNKLVYRDVKQENIGFDVRGDVKVFDFGLSKSLSDKLLSKDGYGYNLTPVTGSFPYMAPEVALKKPYNVQADVYSYAILLWEILSLKKAFGVWTRKEIFENVIQKNQRPLSIKKHWPTLTRSMLKEAWSVNPRRRPDMNRVASLLRGDLMELSSDEEIADRSNHMLQKSLRSARLRAREHQSIGAGLQG